MSVATARRCSCGRRALAGNGLCVECAAVLSTDKANHPREYPLVAVEDLPPNQLCAFCQQRNTPERSEAMYHHNDGPKGTHWYAHAGCEWQKAYDEVEHQRDSRDWDDERPW